MGDSNVRQTREINGWVWSDEEGNYYLNANVRKDDRTGNALELRDILDALDGRRVKIVVETIDP